MHHRAVKKRRVRRKKINENRVRERNTERTAAPTERKTDDSATTLKPGQNSISYRYYSRVYR